MFEGLQTLASAWRTIVHVSEWSGLALGAIAAGVLLFIYVPLARRFVIRGGAAVVLGWLLLIHGDRVGRADVNAQWADARKAAIAAGQERDQMAELKLDAKYQPQLIALQKQADARGNEVKTYEQRILALLARDPKGSVKSAGSCELGDDPVRMRARRQAGKLSGG